MKNCINRRTFHAISASSTLAVAGQSRAQDVAESGRQIAFLSDTHVSADTNAVARGVKMADHLEQVVGQVVDTMPTGSHVIVNGDCAYLKGLPGDYAIFAKLVQPLSNAGLKLHVTMGNHDDRGPMYQSLQSQKANDLAVDDKQVDTIKMPGADIVRLDSFWKVNNVTGQIGAAQLAWLKEFLDNDLHRPVLVVGHHNMQFSPPAAGKPYSGVQDTDELAGLLRQHPKVKAYFYGHTHRWENRTLPGEGASGESSLQLVNLPAVAYVFDAKQPSGWVRGIFSGTNLKLVISSLDTSHPAHEEEVMVSM